MKDIYITLEEDGKLEIITRFKFNRKDKLKDFLDCNDNRNAINELSFRQMINANGQVEYYQHEYLKNGHGKLWYYIEQNDYNEYFVQDHIETEYLEIK